VILKDVLDHSLAEVAEILDTSIPSIKGALHRGRASLRRLADQFGESAPAPIDPAQTGLIENYVGHFVVRNYFHR
jgi:RNA polymerase sigma-70 factor, ECF subfamily